MTSNQEPITPMLAPQAVGINQFAIVANVSDITVLLGQNRHIINQKDGQPGGMGIEWVACYTLSASTAKNMNTALSRAIEIYTDKYGAIPTDPDAKISVNNNVKS